MGTQRNHPSPEVERMMSEDFRDPSAGVQLEFHRKPSVKALESAGKQWAELIHERGDEACFRINGKAARLSILPHVDDDNFFDDLVAFVRHKLHGVVPVKCATAYLGPGPDLDPALVTHPAIERGIASWSPEPAPEAPPKSDVVQTVLKQLRRRTKHYGERMSDLEEYIALLGEEGEESRIMGLELIDAALNWNQDRKDYWSIAELVARDDPSPRVRSLAVLILGDDDDPEGGRGVPGEQLARILTTALEDPEARVRDAGALVLNEAYWRNKVRQKKLPDLPWGAKKQDAKKWPLVLISGSSWFDVPIPKRLPPWVEEEVVRRLRHRAHLKAGEAVRFWQKSGRELSEEMRALIHQRAFERGYVPPGAMALYVQVNGLTDEARAALEERIQRGDSHTRREALETLLLNVKPEEKLSIVASHFDGNLRQIALSYLGRRVSKDEWEICRPVLEYYAQSPDVEVAKAATMAIEETKKYSL